MTAWLVMWPWPLNMSENRGESQDGLTNTGERCPDERRRSGFVLCAEGQREMKLTDSWYTWWQPGGTRVCVFGGVGGLTWLVVCWLCVRVRVESMWQRMKAAINSLFDFKSMFHTPVRHVDTQTDTRLPQNGRLTSAAPGQLTDESYTITVQSHTLRIQNYLLGGFFWSKKHF